MKPKTTKDLPPAWLVVSSYLGELVQTHGRGFATRKEALAELHSRGQQAERSNECWRVEKDRPELPVCADGSFIWKPFDLTIRENWIARNTWLLAQAHQHMRETVVFTYALGRCADPLAARVRGPAPLPAGTDWPACPACSAAMLFVGTLDFRDTPTRRHVPGDALAYFQCFHCVCPAPLMTFFWLKKRQACRLVKPPSGQPARSQIGTPWLVRDCRWADVKEAYNVPGIRHTIVGRRLYTAATVWGNKVGGHIFFIQNDETPRCSCRRTMRFVGQFVSCDEDTAFGDSGIAYIFVCERLKCADTKVVIQEF